jgi:hypothetical protein
MAKRYNYSRAEQTARKLIKKFGQTGEILRFVPGTGQSGAKTPPSYNPAPAIFAVLDYTTRQIDGTRITVDDRLIYLSTEGLTSPPTLSDRIKDVTGQEYEIVPPLRVLNPAGNVVYYEIQGRK